MKLVYLYIKDFPPFQERQFNFDSEVRCSYSEEEKVLKITKGTELPEDFFRISQRQNPYSRMTVSAVVGENGSGKTSLARFFQALCFDDREYEFIIAFESKPEVLCVWYHLPHGLKCENRGYPGKVEYPVTERKEEIPFLGTRFDGCFTVLYYTPCYSPGAMSMGDSRSFLDLSTAGKMVVDVRDYMNPVENGLEHASAYRDAAFNVAETRRILAFSQDYNVVLKRDKNQNEGDQELDLPQIAGISIRQNEWARKEAIGYCKKKSRADEDLGRQGPSVTNREGWAKCLDLLEEKYADDFLLNLFATFSGNYWRNMQECPVDSRREDPLGLKLFRICQAARQNVAEGNVDAARNKLLAGVEDIRNVPSSVETRGYARASDGTYIARLFNRLNALLKGKGFARASGKIFLPLGKDEEEATTLELVDLHAKAKIFSDFLLFDIEPHLSAGQHAFLSLFARLHEYFKKYRLKCDDTATAVPETSSYGDFFSLCGHLVFLDEAETSLHPGWQRKLVSYVIWFFEHMAPREKIHVVFSSHSPNLLSDIPRGNVCFLGHGNLQDKDCPNTFGANIFDLYKSSFFLEEGPVGEFAGSKIRNALKELASLTEHESEGEAKPPGRLSEESKQTLDLVGDELIRRYLDVWKEMGVL